ncbi:hypothetical protein PanWU01x14_353980 [Parasponia andersonii]|uniref:Uncharacterized protein n=1 Tax=Parasponia andersonii TaxID=3476 RepID=A0A2P5A9U4_PARAD|nr:hypothetical protein PanWU01x14_353980 [Parasponia andersonii]
MPVVFVKWAVPAPVLHVLRNTGLRRVFENAPVSILEVDHIYRRVELVLWQRIFKHLSSLAAFLIALGWGSLLRSCRSGQHRPLYSLHV